MLVVMNTAISGTRNEEEWPPVGGVVDVSEAEAEHLVTGGFARLARIKVEAAAMEPATETAALDARPQRKLRAPAKGEAGGSW